MEDGAYQKGNEHGNWLGEAGSGWEIDVAKEEVVNGNIPLSRKLEPKETWGEKNSEQ
jgi:hypothetical protein